MGLFQHQKKLKKVFGKNQNAFIFAPLNATADIAQLARAADL